MVQVSVICSVKNGESTIEETIQSILNQTYKEWEFIIVNDGSTDNTQNIINRYAEIDQRIKPVVTSGVGRGKALNLAIRHTNGEYIVNIDADDPNHPKKIEIQLKHFKENTEYSLLCTDFVIVYNNDVVLWEGTKDRKLKIEVLNEKLPFINPINHSSVMIKKKALADVGFYNELLASQLDYDLWIRLAAKGYKLGSIPLKLASKRIHSNQSFENKNRIKYLVNSLKVQKRAIKALNGPLRAYFLMYGRFSYGLLPQKIRTTIKNRIKNKI